MLERIRHMLIKEFIQIFRDVRMKSIIFVTPVIQLFVFGYAASTDVKDVPTAVYDLDNTQASRDVRDSFIRSRYFIEKAVINTDSEARKLLDRGDIRAILRINRGFQESLMAGKASEVQILVDGSDSNTAGIVLSYAAKIGRQFNREVLSERLKQTKGISGLTVPITLESRSWFNENLESRVFYLPGVIAIIVTLVTLLLTSMAVVREKEIGTMEQIIVTPIKPFEFILGKTMPFALISFVDVSVITAIGVFWFGIPIRGSLLVLFAGAAVYILTTLSAGLLISTISETQQQALMTTFFFFMPAILLSGFMFPIANMPQPVQWLTYLNPLRYFLVIIRGVFLKGVGFTILWTQMAALGVLGAGLLLLASGRFKKTLA